MNSASIRFVVESKRNRHRSGIKLYWWRPADSSARNFGDELTADIIRFISGLDVHWTRVQDCDLVGAGSVLDIVIANQGRRTISIWGTGFIDNGEAVTIDRFKILAVRGELTRKRLGVDHNVVLGDPGLLVSCIFKPHEQSSDIGIVLHYQDIHSGNIVDDLQNKGFRVINPHMRPVEVAREISQCRAVFSTSLHGLIFSDSYGIPNFRIKLSDLKGGDFKFRDYYSATQRNMTEVEAGSLFKQGPNGKVVNWALDNFRPIKNITDIQNSLLQSFPYQLKYNPEAIVRK